MLYRSHRTNLDLLTSLKHAGILKTSIVENVMKMVDRKHFTTHEPYADCPQSIGLNATISAPHIHAHALEFFKNRLTKPNCKALDIGCGSGYLTLCMSLMNDSHGLVVGVDHFDELVDLSKKNVANAGYKRLLDNGAIKFISHDGRQGYPPDSPYDVIYVGAAAASVPQTLIDQIAIGGAMLIPVGSFNQELKIYERGEDGSISMRYEFGVRFVPLTNKDDQYSGA